MRVVDNTSTKGRNQVLVRCIVIDQEGAGGKSRRLLGGLVEQPDLPAARGHLFEGTES